MPVPVLQPHQVAGLYVAAPRFEPALHEKGWELVDGCTQLGGFSSTALFGHITGAAVVVVPAGAVVVPAWAVEGDPAVVEAAFEVG